MDDWDSLLHLEENAFQEGLEAGAEEANKSSELRVQGETSGFRHGFAFHMEVSFMETCVKRFLSELEDNESATLSKAGYRGMNKERMRKKCLLLISRIESIPTSNSMDTDFVNLLQELRSSYKAIGGQLHPFIPEETSTKKLDW